MHVEIIPSKTCKVDSKHQKSRFHLVPATNFDPNIPVNCKILEPIGTDINICVTKFCLHLIYIAKNIASEPSSKNVYINGPSGIGKSVSLLFLASYLQNFSKKIHTMYIPDCNGLFPERLASAKFFEELIFAFFDTKLFDSFCFSNDDKIDFTVVLSNAMNLVSKYLIERGEMLFIILDQVNNSVEVLS